LGKQSIIVEAEAGSGDVTDAGASRQRPEVRDDNDDENDDDDDDVGRMRPHHIDKNMYTFSAATGHALQQQTGNIKSLV